MYGRPLRVNVPKNQTKFKKCGHGQKSISLRLCQFEGLSKLLKGMKLVSRNSNIAVGNHEKRLSYRKL